MIPESKLLTRCFLLTAVILLCGIFPAFGADLKVLPGHVPKVLSSLAPIGRLAATNKLWLAIGLPLRDRAGLENFVAHVSDPASPNFRHYLTREELTARFGPTEQDYEAVKNFALSNGLAIAVTHDNRLVLDVSGSVSAVEKAFQIKLRSYRHPTETRDFFAPDSEPSVDAKLPVMDVEGLTDYWLPHPKWRHNYGSNSTAKKGTAPDGSGDLFGDDFRNAYVPGTSLTGAGQSVGLLEFDGFYTNDVLNYAKLAGNGRTNIVIETVLVDGYQGIPTGNAGEIELDIEMAMAIAPGLDKIVSFEAGPGKTGRHNDVLNTMLAYSNILNLSCSFGWNGPSNTTDNIFLSMAAVGQTFFNASGDWGAFTTGSNSVNGVDNPNSHTANAPSSNPFITQVGGTILKMSGSGVSWFLKWYGMMDWIQMATITTTLQLAVASAVITQFQVGKQMSAIWAAEEARHNLEIFPMLLQMQTIFTRFTITETTAEEFLMAMEEQVPPRRCGLVSWRWSTSSWRPTDSRVPASSIQPSTPLLRGQTTLRFSMMSLAAATLGRQVRIYFMPPTATTFAPALGR